MSTRVLAKELEGRLHEPARCAALVDGALGSATARTDRITTAAVLGPG
jgi:hypothetical protein